MKTEESLVDVLPKFFKVYLPDDSGDDLEIPVSFNTCLPNSAPKTVTVRSIYGNAWTLRLKKCSGETEKFLMVNGWKKIVKDEDLKGGEFLAFEFDGSRLFNFCIYGQDTCKRLASSVRTKETEDESDGEDDIINIDDDDDDEDQDYGVEASVEKGDDDSETVEVGDKAVVDDDHRRYLDDPDNPSFTMFLNPKKKSQLLIPTKVTKDYNLNFPENITVVDPLVAKFGTLEKKIKVQDNGSVFVKAFGSIYKRNYVKPKDKMIFEVKKSASGLVHTLKVYIVRG